MTSSATITAVESVRIVALCAFIDRELFRTVPRPAFKQQDARGRFTASIPGGEALNAAFEELLTLYHAEKINLENADEAWLLPPHVLTTNAEGAGR